MTTCAEMRDLLLEASPEELRGDGYDPLAVHLRSCAACRRRAGLLLHAEDALDEALGAAPAPDVDSILALAAAAPVEVGWKARAARMARAVAPARRAWMPLAAAAALTGLLLVTRSPGPPPPPAGAPAGALPLVESASAGGVAILETDNPDITVLWFFEQGT